MRFKVGDKVQVKSLKEILKDPNTEASDGRIITSYFIEENGERVNVHDSFT